MLPNQEPSPGKLRTVDVDVCLRSTLVLVCEYDEGDAGASCTILCMPSIMNVLLYAWNGEVAGQLAGWLAGRVL